MEVIAGPDEVDATIDEAGIVTIAAGELRGGAILEVSASDAWGTVGQTRFTVVFDGTGCLPSDSFSGIDPTTCTEIDVDDLAGDDRGGITLTPTGILWVRTNVITGEYTVVTKSFADDCDTHSIAIDPTGLQVFSHAEGGCWLPGVYLDETIYVCTALLAPNDGSIDDSGDGD